MSREIKFRGWDKYDKKMIYDLCQVDSFWHYYSYSDDTGLHFGKTGPNGVGEDFENKYIMQYTGLKDKNNKEIYEGDILQEENGDLDVCLYLEVVASYGFVPIEIYMYNYKEQGENINELSLVEEMYKEYDIQCFPRNLTPRDYLEVIGNIYENPELLEVDK